jgi:exodeoxyribonuclease VII small subunit
MTYEAAVHRIEAIVAALSRDSQSLSDSLALFAEGIGLLRDATVELSAIETRAKELVERARDVFDVVEGESRPEAM